MTTRLSATLIAVCAALLLGTTASAMGEAGTGGGPVYLGFRNHVVLGPILHGRVSSDAPSSYAYSVLAKVRVDGREVARLRFRGHATPQAAALSVPVSAAKRRAIRVASRRHPHNRIVVNLAIRAVADGNRAADATTSPARFLLVLP